MSGRRRLSLIAPAGLAQIFFEPGTSTKDSVFSFRLLLLLILFFVCFWVLTHSLRCSRGVSAQDFPHRRLAGQMPHAGIISQSPVCVQCWDQPTQHHGVCLDTRQVSVPVPTEPPCVLCATSLLLQHRAAHTSRDYSFCAGPHCLLLAIYSLY